MKLHHRNHIICGAVCKISSHRKLLFYCAHLKNTFIVLCFNVFICHLSIKTIKCIVLFNNIYKWSFGSVFKVHEKKKNTHINKRKTHSRKALLDQQPSISMFISIDFSVFLLQDSRCSFTTNQQLNQPTPSQTPQGSVLVVKPDTSSKCNLKS